jgi:hypothetical protein
MRLILGGFIRMTAVRSDSARSWLQRNVLEVSFLSLGAMLVLIAAVVAMTI